ncbi:MAG TPA: YbaB/EbfC family nucleoid-associated protein [Chloroflexi bacterium]|nr:YbaB/EbfC family nucleoid-associated protein [Chloroflexota bacterium]
MKRGGLPKGMAQQIQAMQQKLQQAQQELAKAEVTGSAGGGVVKVTLRGDQTCTKVEIAPEMLADADHEMLQDLVLAAFNQAQEAMAQLTAEKLGPFSSALGM